MKLFLYLLTLSLLTHMASAAAFASESSLSVEKFKAIADATTAQHILNGSQVIKSIALDRRTNDSEIFVVQIVDSSGQCYAQSADVYVPAVENSEVVVSFPKMPFSSCK